VAEQYDLVIIGGGNAGYVPAIRASQLGMNVALVEKEPHLGGTCLNWGCIPTKALLHTASLLNDIKHGKDHGVITDGIEFDYAQASKHKDQVVGQLRQGVKGLMKKNKVTVYQGVGSFVEPKKIKVEGESGEQELEAKNVLIATGSAVNTLPGLEFDGEKVISSDDVLTMQGYPNSIIVLGSGAVGVEFASMYNDFGADVTVVELLDRIVPLEDPEVSAELEKAFNKRGIKTYTGAKADPESLKKTDDGITIEVETGDGRETLDAEMLLVAVGRKTVTEGLNLDATKVEVDDRGIIQVDEFYRTAEDGVYAAGDVVGGYWLAHAASHEGIVAVEHMAGEDPHPIDQDLIPRVTFCRPEVASFGLSEEQAKEKGYEVKVGKFPFRGIGKALIEGDTGGFVKIVADADTDLLLGMHAIGPKVTDLIAEGVFAKLVEGTPQEIAMAVHAHPTLSESFAEAAMAVDGNQIHF
jgi:dihydrolipoamide dehydrogenase